ncbi:MAG TPA: LPS export ABC transporter permease LptG [Acidobacteriota bacterium]|nr:LPS export ABC transporter permease LptG [Acidobacteriota bacterium]
MKRIHRIVYQEIFPPGAIALLVLTFVVFTREFGRVSRLFIQQGAEAGLVGELMISLLPQILVYTFPLSFLIGTLVGFSRLSTDSEVVALRAGGVSIYQMIGPVMRAAVVVSGLTALLTFWLFPLGNWRFQEIRHELGARPVQSEIKPRVFFEDLPDKILYIEDQVLQTQEWKGVFLADSAAQEGERLILARTGRLLTSPDAQRLQLSFQGGLMYEIDPEAPREYSWNRFGTFDVPVRLPEERLRPNRPKRPREMPLDELQRDIEQGTPEARRFALVELNRRLAIPVSALLFAILGVTLGARHHRGGRAYGIVVSMVLAFSYYALLESGVEAAEDQVVSVWLGLWGPNILLLLISVFSLRMANTEGGLLARINNHPLTRSLRRALRKLAVKLVKAGRLLGRGIRQAIWRIPQLMPRIARVIDLYVVRNFLLYLAMTLAVTLALYYLFTFFDLLNDIFSNNVTSGMVLEYFLFLMPQALTLLVPISVLIATLITFGVLQKTNQMVAFKSCGVSVYQVAFPVFALAVLISTVSYLNQEYVLPYANQRQDNLRSVIKGRPAQTHYTPGRSWIFGEGDRLYHYSYYDPDRDRFAELDIYELDISQNTLKSHTHARQASWDRDSQSWVLRDGWRLHFSGTVDQFEKFTATQVRLPEAPDYFEAGVAESSKMTYGQLLTYIQDLQQGGFEVDDLKTELYTKLSFPLVPLIMILLGVPFAFTLGRKGALYGIAAGVLIGMIYWGAFGVFGVLGAGGLLAPLLAAWGPNLLFASLGAFLFLTVRT